MAVRIRSKFGVHGPIGTYARQLHGEPRDIDAVAGGIAFVGGVRPLQEIGDVGQDLAVAEGKILVQDGQFLIALRKIDQDLRLQAGVDVFRKIEGAGVVIHGRHQRNSGCALILIPATIDST